MYNPTNPGFSTQNQTRFIPNYDLTVSDNPYATSPYDLQNIPTPPKPPHTHNRLVLSLVLVIIALVLVIAGSVIWLQYANRTTSSSSNSTSTQVTAQSLVQDFIKHNLPIDQIHYGTKLNQWLAYSGNITEQSSVSFVDPSICNGFACGMGSVWLGVYLTSSDAQIVYDDIRILESTPSPVETSALPETTIVVNQCLVIGETNPSQFIQIVKKVCV